MSLAMKARQKVKKKTVKDKIFGCDLLEHLQMSGQEVPQVLKSCSEFVEEHGVVDGIYRLCGIASNVQRLRQEFDIERPPDLNKSTYLQDVHCVSSLCKAYFRELPNPLLTYQLYDKFADAVAIQLEEQRLIKIREVLKELPLPHYRTLEYLMRHLLRMASYSSQTNMHARNLAIVWAPNLLRSKDIESSGFNGTAAFMEVRVQSIVVEFILTHVEQLFGDWTNYGNISEGSSFASMNWPTCVPVDYYRSLSYNLPNMLNHGDGPPQIRPYHTIIELSDHKRKGSLKAKKWKSIFNLGRSNPDSKRKSQKQDDKDGKSGTMSLRPAKSMDSLSAVPHAYASDLEQNNWSIQSPRNQLSLRRESLGSPSKTENTESIFTDSEERLHSMDTNDAGYEEEEEEGGGQAQSEPTTPKPARSSITGNPTGRSPKTNPSRAEKCVGVHISGPFSVTLPFHITSNLSRLTRGMECPGLSVMTPQKSSDRFCSLEGNLSPESDDTHKVKASHGEDQESDQHRGTEVTEDPMKESDRISIEVQDSFSFLDAPDTSTEKAPENTLESEVLGYELEAENKTEEFSVEPPADDLCTGDEQAYFMPTGFVEESGHWRMTPDSLDDIYLSANDDLSPGGVTLENILWSLDEQCTVHATLPTDAAERTVREEQLMLHEESFDQEQLLTTTTGVPNIEVDGWQQQDSDDGDITKSSGEQSEDTGSYAPTRERQNSDSAENSPAVPTPEHTQHDRTDEEENVNDELEDRAGTCGDSAVEQNSLQARAQQSMSNDLLPNSPVEDGDSKDEDCNAKVPDSQDTDNASADPLDRNTSENGVSRMIPGQQSYCTEARAAADNVATIDKLGCSETDPHLSLHPSVDDTIGDDGSGHQISIKPKDSSQQEESANEDNEADLRPPYVSIPPVELVNLVPYRMHSDGSVAVKLMATTNKVQQAKSVPVVPPKPQFAKLPPALKSKIQAGSSSANSRSQKSEQSSHMEVPETSNEATLARRSSWRSTTSISFDTAMALAKERQSQNPARRMYTNCVGDPLDITDTSKADHSFHAPRFTVQSANSRMHRPYSCMALSCAEGELHTPQTVEEPIHGLQSIFTHEPDAYSKEVPHRNRLSMPRLGQACVGDEQSKCHQQRRSLL